MNSRRYYLESLLRGTKMGSPYTIDMCEYDLKELDLKPKNTNKVFENDVDYLLHIICEEFEITIADALSRCRKRECVEVRQMFSKIVVSDLRSMTLKSCGKYLGNRDHSTIINSISQFNNIFETEKNIAEKYWVIKSKFDKYLKVDDVGL